MFVRMAGYYDRSQKDIKDTIEVSPNYRSEVISFRSLSIWGIQLPQ